MAPQLARLCNNHAGLSSPPAAAARPCANTVQPPTARLLSPSLGRLCTADPSAASIARAPAPAVFALLGDAERPELVARVHEALFVAHAPATVRRAHPTVEPCHAGCCAAQIALHGAPHRIPCLATLEYP